MFRATLRRKSFLIIIGFVSCLGCGCAAPERFSFDVAADMRFFTPPIYKGAGYFSGVCAAIRDLGPGAFMVSPGDCDPPALVRATLDEILGEDYQWYPVVGNHEGDKSGDMPYLRRYNRGGNTLPSVVHVGPPGALETCYSFDYDNAHFVVINQYYDGVRDMTGDGDVGDPLYAWLAADLEASDRPLVFVFGHEPSVVVPDLSNGRVRHRGDSLDKYAVHNHRFWSLLRAHGVVAYFCGHTHNASVAKLNGVWQIDCGHARGLGDPGAPSTFIKVRVHGEAVYCDVYRNDTKGGPYRLALIERLR